MGYRESLLPASYRDNAGASIRASTRLLRPALSSRTARFPRSGWKRRPVHVQPAQSKQQRTQLKRWRAYPACGLVCCTVRRKALDDLIRTLRPGYRAVLRPPSPRAPLLCEHYSASWLLRAHVPIPMPLAFTSSVTRVIESAPAACASHGWSVGPSRFCTASLCWSAAPSMPAVPQVHTTSSSLMNIGLRLRLQARLSATSPTTRFHVGHDFGTAGIS